MSPLRVALVVFALALAPAGSAACGGDDDPYEVYSGQGVSFEYPTGEGWTLNEANVGEGMRAELIEAEEDYSTASQVRLDGRNPYETNDEAYESYRDPIEGFELVEEREIEIEGTLGSRIFVTEHTGTLPDGTDQAMVQTDLFYVLEDGPGGRFGWELSVIAPDGASYPDAERVIDSFEIGESQ